jgi:hypothetical protein
MNDVVTTEEPKLSPYKARENAVKALSPEELLEHALKLNKQLSEAKSLLRIAAKKFRWLQKPTDAQDIDKFLDNAK